MTTGHGSQRIISTPSCQVATLFWWGTLSLQSLEVPRNLAPAMASTSTGKLRLTDRQRLDQALKGDGNFVSS